MEVPFRPPKPSSISESGLSEPLAKLLEARGSRHFGQAKRDPESSPAIGEIQAILDSRFRGNDGTATFARGSSISEFSFPR
jgi:hypothetical protein